MGDNSAKIATTAFGTTAIAGAGVASFNGRTGAVVLTLAGRDCKKKGDEIARHSPASRLPRPQRGHDDDAAGHHGLPIAAVTAGAVVSFNSRDWGGDPAGPSDVSAVGGALLALSTFTGVPGGPHRRAGHKKGQLATTAFVAAALAGGAGVVTFETRGRARSCSSPLM